MFNKVGNYFMSKKGKDSLNNRDKQAGNNLRNAARPDSPRDVMRIDQAYEGSSNDNFQQINSNIQSLNRIERPSNIRSEESSVGQVVNYEDLFKNSYGEAGVNDNSSSQSRGQFETTRNRSNTNQRNMSQWVSGGRRGGNRVMPPPPPPQRPVTLDASQFATTRRQSNTSKTDTTKWFSDARKVGATSFTNERKGVRENPQQSSLPAKRLKGSDQFDVYKSSVGQGKTCTAKPSQPPLPPVETSRSKSATERRSYVSSSAAHGQYKNVEIPRGAVSSSLLSSLMPPPPPPPPQQQQQQSSSQFASNGEGAKRISRSSTDLPPQKRQKKVKSFVSEIKDPDTGKILKEEHEVYVSGETEAFARAWLSLARESLRKKSLRNNKKS